MTTFSHRDPGTPEKIWGAELETRDLPRVDLDIDALFVVAAHPDDETLGVGGLIRRVSDAGVPITIMSVTDGEASHPQSSTIAPDELARRRRGELETAMRTLAPWADLHFLGIPDTALREHRGALEAVLRAAIRPLTKGRPLVVAPWSGDRQRDHRIAGEVTQRVCAALGVRYLAYPIWLWHWGGADDVPWAEAEIVELTNDDIAAKSAALACHRTQTEPLSSRPGDEVMLHEGMQAHFTRSVEVLFSPATLRPTAEAAGMPPAATLQPGYFDAFYERHDDPWGFDSRWYEARKRAVLLASLPRQGYRRGLELGCATGALTVDLAKRCDALLAVDIAEKAIELARDRLGEAQNVEFQRLDLPGHWPAGRFDLVVFSEIGYYWTAPDLERALARMLESLDVDGHIVACHWRHTVPEHAVTGDGVHVALRTLHGLESLVHHEEDDFVLEVFARPPARSVAAEEDLV